MDTEIFFQAIDQSDIATMEALLKSGLDPNCKTSRHHNWYCGAGGGHGDPPSDTALVYAARLGKTAAVKLLITCGASLTDTGEDFYPPFEMAAREGHTEIVELLMNAGAPMQNEGCTALAFAASGGHAGTIEFLIKSGVDVAGAEHFRPLGYAGGNKRAESFDCLLKHGADFHEAMQEAVKSESADCVKAVLAYRNGKSVDERLFLEAVQTRRFDLSEALLDAGVADEMSAFITSQSFMWSREYHGHDFIRKMLERANLRRSQNLPATDVNARGHEGQTALTYAIQANDIQATRILIEGGADVEVDAWGNTPLAWAISSRSIELVNLLFAHGAKLNQAVFKCASQRGIEFVKLLLEEAKRNNAAIDLDVGDSLGQTPLIQAASADQAEVVEYLVKAGVNVNVHDRYGRTALDHTHGQNKERITSILLQAGARYGNIVKAAKNAEPPAVFMVVPSGRNTAQTDRAHTPTPANTTVITVTKPGHGTEGACKEFFDAIDNADEKTAQQLLEGGLNPNSYDEEGRTILLWASASNLPSFINLLIQYGADPNLMSANRATPLDWALNISGDSLQTVQALINGGADVNLIGKSELLCKAATNGDPRIVKLFLDAGARLDGPGNALYIAAQNGHLEAVKLLLNAGAKIDAPANIYRETPLMIAARSGHAEVVAVLLAAGANKGLKNGSGETALQLAANHPDCRQLLQ